MTVQTNPAGFEVGAGDKIHTIQGRQFCIKVKDLGDASGCYVMFLEKAVDGTWKNVAFIDEGLDTRLNQFGGSAVRYIREFLLPKLQAILNSLFGATAPPASTVFTFAQVDAEIQKIAINGTTASY